jgi:hypothetical protein
MINRMALELLKKLLEEKTDCKVDENNNITINGVYLGRLVIQFLNTDDKE